MKNITKILLPIFFLMALYSCNGECVRCQKAGQQTLNYCENDFPSSIEYHNQLNGLDSLGYDCVTK